MNHQVQRVMSWMTARATLKMTETELTRKHSVRTVTHFNTLPPKKIHFLRFLIGFASVSTNNLRSLTKLRLYSHTQPPLNIAGLVTSILGH